ncbi:ankyrin repeat and ELMO domain-containing protein D-like [Musca domestica]|uniref:Ankyrin repeat and ELMO domain-containing protein D-like n=1 Tax=Musca domestica TaxID=7370 RepID=A0A1I8M3P8_MUSDO|nr:ankyrin repeat and ELMO domain-containing protein D-like [Musca domestica]
MQRLNVYHFLRSPSSSSTTFSQSMGNNISRVATRQAAIKSYTERDRLTLSDHSSVDYTNRRHVTLLLNSPSSEILNSIANSATSNSLNYQHQQQNISDRQADSLRSSNNDNENLAAANTNGTNPNQNQKWKSVRAVMAYYCSLRRIKRNGPL